jgi:hypothetical protein
MIETLAPSTLSSENKESGERASQRDFFPEEKLLFVCSLFSSSLCPSQSVKVEDFFRCFLLVCLLGMELPLFDALDGQVVPPQWDNLKEEFTFTLKTPPLFIEFANFALQQHAQENLALWFVISFFFKKKRAFVSHRLVFFFFFFFFFVFFLNLFFFYFKKK